MHTRLLGRRNKELLAVMLLLNIAAAGLFGFLFLRIKKENEHISDLVHQIDAAVSEENTLHSIKTLVIETAPMREKLGSFIVGKEEAVSFLELLETLGTDSRVSVDINSVSPAEIAGASQFETLRIALTMTGAWADTLRFLGLLEFLPYEARVEQLTVSHPGLSRGSWRADVTLAVLKEK